MENYAIKFKFKTAVHFGSLIQNPDITNSDFILQNDTIFSALVIEANNLFGQPGVDKIYNLCNKKITFSSMMPFQNENYFIPVPTMYVEAAEQNNKENYAKKLKKLKYIPVSYLKEYLIKVKENNLPIDTLIENQNNFGNYAIEQKLIVNRLNTEENKPFHFGSFTFNKDCGTYILISCEPTDIDFLKTLFTALGLTGIGGKKSVGYGKFDYEIIKLQNSENKDFQTFNNLLQDNYKRYMSLSICLPVNLTDEILKDAYFNLVRRSGFIDSTTYNNNIMKKKDTFAFCTGSTFTKKFEGEIKNVASDIGKHPVYKNLRPFFIGVE